MVMITVYADTINCYNSESPEWCLLIMPSIGSLITGNHVETTQRSLLVHRHQRRSRSASDYSASLSGVRQYLLRSLVIAEFTSRSLFSQLQPGISVARCDWPFFFYNLIMCVYLL